MKVVVYGCGKNEELYVERCRQLYGLHIITTSQRAREDNAHLASGCLCVSVLSTPLPKETIEALYAQGVRFISTRTVGYDHIDLDACRRLQIQVSNVNYSPESVADYTIMLILMVLRKMKLIMGSAQVQDYSFHMVEGKNLKDRVVGIIGVGSIGDTLIQHIQGFGCKILAYTPHPKQDEDNLHYVDLNTLYQQSDIISLHVPLNKNTYHMINAISIANMKDGVLLINTARGALIDNEALICGIEKGKIAGAALDVVEGETGIYYNNKKGYITAQRAMSILNAFPNVIMSPHMAFLTEESTCDMVMNSMRSCICYRDGKDDDFRIC